MKQSRKTILAVCALAIPTLLPTGGFAAQVSDTMDVSVNVTAACSLQKPQVLDFGSINPTDTTPIAKAFSILVTCDPNTTYDVAIDAGSNFDGNFRRVFGSASSTIPYELFQPDGTTPWGDAGVTNNDPVLSALGTGGTDTHTGSAILRLDLVSGLTALLHTDVVNVTVNFGP